MIGGCGGGDDDGEGDFGCCCTGLLCPCAGVGGAAVCLLDLSVP